MSENHDIFKKECLKDIKSDYPESLLSRVLKEMPGISFKKDSEPPHQFLERNWGKPEFARKFMDIFDDYTSNGSGRVHIIFYQLSDERYLNQLRDEKRQREIIQEEDRELINKKIFSWGSPKPKLVEIRHNGRDELLFKWVQTRRWDERVSGSTENSPPKYERRLERSVNYFVVDLRNGNAQLRIQLLKPNALKPLKEEYELYREEIKKVIDFNEFRRMALESVAKNFLSNKDIHPKSWEIQIPNGGNFTAKGKPALYISFFGGKIKILNRILSKINIIKWLDFFGRKLICECQLKNSAWGPLDVKVKLDGERDILTIVSSCDQLQFTTIIDKVLKIKENSVLDKLLNKYVKDEPLQKRVVLSFDYQFSRFKKNEVAAGYPRDREWLLESKVLKAIQELCIRYPNNFFFKGSGKNLTLCKI